MLYNGVGFVGDDEVPTADYPDEPLLRRLARKVLFDYWLAAATDVFESRRLAIPLGAGIECERPPRSDAD